MKKLASTLLLFLTANVNAALDINQLKTLTDTGEMTAAYNLASENLVNNEGDPDFDYYYGIAAIDSGHASEGVFALERVVLVNPDHHAARLELGRGYFILEEFARSKQEFLTVLNAKPPKDVKDKIYAYIDAIRLQEGRYTTTSASYFELGYGSDSNINSGPTTEDLDTGTFVIPLGQDSIEQKDSFSEATFLYNINTPVAVGTSFFTSISANKRKNSDTSLFDTTIITLNTGFRFLHAQSTYSVDLVAQQFDLDGEDYRKLTGLNTSWRNRLSESSSINMFLQFAKQDFFEQDVKNTDVLTLGAGYTKRFTATLSPVFFTNIYVSQDKPEQDTASAKQTTERDSQGFRLGTVLSTSASTSTQISLSYQDSKYGAPDELSGILREDTYTNLGVDFSWLLDKNWTFIAKANTSHNDSTKTVNVYDRTLYSIHIRYDFK